MNVLFWNVRGLNEDTRRVLSDHCQIFKPLLMGIVEPKSAFANIPLAYWHSINVIPIHQNVRLGMSSNIWVFAAPQVTTSMVFSSSQAVILDCSWHTRRFRAAFIHGDSSPGERRHLWIDLLNHVVDNMFFFGDFNAVKGAHERISNCLPSAASCREFRDFIDASGFFESNTTGLSFTWCGRRHLPSHVESILDRCLFSAGFVAMWDSLNTHILPRLSSDHSPLILQCMEGASWNAPTNVNCPIRLVMMKLKRLRLALKNWNRQVFGNVDDQLRQLQSSLEGIQRRIANEGYSESLFEEEVEVQARVGTILSRKSALLKQKSRINWLNDGDRNTSFFHNSFKMWRKQLMLPQLMIDGTIVFDQEVIASHIVDYFSNLFSENMVSQVTTQEIQTVVQNCVTQQHNSQLTSIPADEEIKAAVLDLSGDSAAGPDGFIGIFFQRCWDTIQSDIIKAVRTFFTKSYLPHGMNSNTLILIPKKDPVETVADVRPTILSNFFFKIISKILATRLSSVAADCVSHNQFGFIRGRLIHDCIMLGSEGVNCMKRSCQGKNMACKVDIKKAFDTMIWKFIMCAMSAMGFDQSFLRWLMIIFSSAMLSILFNGKLCGYFACSRGVRQGDPLSPIIFGIAEDVLSNLLLKAVDSGNLIPMRMSQNSLFPTHLLYADDILIFCKASTQNARTLRDIFKRYGEFSGQICSSEKSHVYFGKGVSLCYQRHITRILCFSTAKLPMVYLGAPLFVGRPRATHLAAIKDRIINKFARWKGLQLSMAALTYFGVKELIPDLVDDSFCLLGKGASIYLWNDDWLGYVIADKINIPAFIRSRLNQTVEDYFYDGVWHFTQDFVDEYPHIICDILLLPIGSNEDTRFWKPSVQGDVTAKLAFVSRCHRFPRVSWGLWLWEKFIHRRLPTLDKLIPRGLIIPNYCAFCLGAAEDMDHILWSCVKVRPIWADFLSWFDLGRGIECHDIQSFLIFSWSVDMSSQLNNFWKLGVITLIWTLWTARNKSHFEGTSMQHNAVLAFLRSSFLEVDTSFGKMGFINNQWADYLVVRRLGIRVRERPPPKFDSVYWSPPAFGWLKANTDGSAVGAPGRIFAGGVFRDWKGFVRGCFHVDGGIGFAFEAELLGIISAIEYAFKNGWKKVWFEADSSYVVHMLSTKSSCIPWRFAAIWGRALELLNMMEFRITHIFIEGNTPADIMASPHTPIGYWNHNIDLIKDAVIRDLSVDSHVRQR
ncbi:uncharacterized protein LOC130998549 [Salvia miltiorrhiza]|uniref:uncharacterized protein LOC130998549 n=1 Tax=Salvia miltiorrhiza TaxID=226208 RepID=UPI0025ABA147|nr:uncharacterized protein LOC130998549 [Salvia miltiorrhiza]